MILALWFLLFSPSAHAQLPLPDEPWLPPPASAGARTSSGTPNPQWSTLLGNLLFFYEAQRSGELPDTNRVEWRNSSCTDDGKEAGLDLSGGYYDAGDYIKATYPLSFTLMSICWGADDFGEGYELANQTAYLDDMLRWGLDWLIKAHPEERKLYVQVGNTRLDNGYWGGDRNIPEPRSASAITDSKPGTDAAAGVAAAFAACSGLYAGKDFGEAYSSPAPLKDEEYASTLMKHAKQLYSFAVDAKGGQKTYQTNSDVSEAYESSGFKDELTLAALFLAWADNDSDLFETAKKNYNDFKLSGGNGVFNWDSKTPALAVLFAQITNSGSGLSDDSDVWHTEAERYFDNIVTEKYEKQSASMTNGGLLYYDSDSFSASLNPSMNAAMLLTRYAPIAKDDRKSDYLSFAQSQIDYALGKNPMNVPYIVGINPNSPSNPHSAMASGGNDIDHIDDSPVEMAHILYGAAIGGPGKDDKYHNIRSDWPQTEVALDYNAPLLTIAAMHVLDDSNDPFYTSIKAGAYAKVKPKGKPCDAAFKCGPSKLSQAGKIAIIVVTVIMGLIILGLIGWYVGMTIKKKNLKAAS